MTSRVDDPVSHLLAFLSGMPRLRVEVTFKDGVFMSTVVADTTEGAVTYKEEGKRTVGRPVAFGIALPYIYVMEYRATNFTFRSPAEEAIEWISSPERPPFIAEPILSADQTTLSMMVLNSTMLRQRSEFLLIPDMTMPLGQIKFDPTVVNNPDSIPPDEILENPRYES